MSVNTGSLRYSNVRLTSKLVPLFSSSLIARWRAVSFTGGVDANIALFRELFTVYDNNKQSHVMAQMAVMISVSFCNFGSMSLLSYVMLWECYLWVLNLKKTSLIINAQYASNLPFWVIVTSRHLLTLNFYLLTVQASSGGCIVITFQILFDHLFIIILWRFYRCED